EDLSRLREHNRWSLRILLLAALVDEAAVFELFECNGITDILAVFITQHFDAGARNVERDIAATDYNSCSDTKAFRLGQALVVDGLLFGLLLLLFWLPCNRRMFRLSLGDCALFPVVFSGFVVVDNSHKILIGTK